MQLIKSVLFNNIDDIIFGFSTKIGLDRKDPFYFNLSYNVGDSKLNVYQNRDEFFYSLGLEQEQVAFQKQVHGDTIKIINEPGYSGESDALITKRSGIGLAISTADCPAIFIYDVQNKIIAAVHSGWRGTQKKIIQKTLEILENKFDSNPRNLLVFVGPSISQKNYEVGPEVADLFDPIYVRSEDSKLFLDIKKSNLDMILNFGVPEKQIEVSPYCSFEEKELLHSYRREGKVSGRAFGIIAMKEKHGK